MRRCTLVGLVALATSAGYKSAARMMIRRTIAKLNAGDHRPALAMFASDATMVFPGDNPWANQYRPARTGREAFPTHRGRTEIGGFLEQYVSKGLQMAVEDVVVNGPPWRTRAAVRVHDWLPGDGQEPDRYNNRAVLFVESKWGKIRRQEDYEDTQRAAALELPADGASHQSRRPSAETRE